MHLRISCAAVLNVLLLAVGASAARIAITDGVPSAGTDLNYLDRTGFHASGRGDFLDARSFATDGFGSSEAQFNVTTNDAVSNPWLRPAASDLSSVRFSGMYFFTRSGGNKAVVIRPGRNDFTPGSFYVRAFNDSSVPVVDPVFSYDFLYQSDSDPIVGTINAGVSAGASEATDSAISGSTFSYAAVAGLSVNGADLSTSSDLQSITKTAQLTGVTIASGEALIIQLTHDSDTSGFGRIGFDNFNISLAPTVIPEPLAAGGGASLSLLALRRRRSATLAS